MLVSYRIDSSPSLAQMQLDYYEFGRRSSFSSSNILLFWLILLCILFWYSSLRNSILCSSPPPLAWLLLNYYFQKNDFITIKVKTFSNLQLRPSRIAKILKAPVSQCLKISNLIASVVFCAKKSSTFWQTCKPVKLGTYFNHTLWVDI